MGVRADRQRLRRESKRRLTPDKPFYTARASGEAPEDKNERASETSSKPNAVAAWKTPPTCREPVLQRLPRARKRRVFRWHEFSSRSKCRRHRGPRSRLL